MFFIENTCLFLIIYSAPDQIVMISAAVVSVVCLVLGLVISYLYATPTGASIVICNMAVFFIYAAIAKIRGLD